MEKTIEKMSFEEATKLLNEIESDKNNFLTDNWRRNWYRRLHDKVHNYEQIIKSGGKKK